jgi:hypothetical protein
VAAARFLSVGVLSVVVDTALIVVGRELVGLPLAVATTAAFVLTLGVNFWLNLRVVFQAVGRVAGRLARYLVLVAVNYLLTMVIVLALRRRQAHGGGGVRRPELRGLPALGLRVGTGITRTGASGPRSGTMSASPFLAPAAAP